MLIYHLSPLQYQGGNVLQGILMSLLDQARLLTPQPALDMALWFRPPNPSFLVIRLATDECPAWNKEMNGAMCPC